MLLLGYWKILVITALYVLSQFYSKMHAHHLALNLTDKVMWLQKKNFSLCFSFYFIFHCFKLWNSCYLKWLWIEIVFGKKNCQANLKYLMLKKDHLSTDINWLLIYFPCRSGCYLCNSISWWCHESYRRCI